MKIAISGLSGCGNTTASNNVGKALGLKVVNLTFRAVAKEAGLSVAEIQELLAGDLEVDAILDKKLIEIAKKEENCVVGTRLSGWVIDADLSVWLNASLETRAARIASRGEGQFDEILKATDLRDKQNIDRYKRLYGIDMLKRDHFDLIVNTERLTQEQVAALIVAAAKLAKEDWEKPNNPYPEKVKAIINRRLSGWNLNKVKNNKLKKVIACLQSK